MGRRVRLGEFQMGALDRFLQQPAVQRARARRDYDRRLRSIQERKEAADQLWHWVIAHLWGSSTEKGAIVLTRYIGDPPRFYKHRMLITVERFLSVQPGAAYDRQEAALEGLIQFIRSTERACTIDYVADASGFGSNYRDLYRNQFFASQRIVPVGVRLMAGDAHEFDIVYQMQKLGKETLINEAVNAQEFFTLPPDGRFNDSIYEQLKKYELKNTRKRLSSEPAVRDGVNDEQVIALGLALWKLHTRRRSHDRHPLSFLSERGQKRGPYSEAQPLPMIPNPDGLGPNDAGPVGTYNYANDDLGQWLRFK